jgi:hypothetical protein
MQMSSEKPLDFVEFAAKFNQRARIVVYGSYEIQMAGMAETQIQQACAAAVTLGQAYATFVIDSRGELNAPLNRMLAFMDVYRHTPEFRFVGYVVGFAYGRALQLLQYCDWRVAHASAMLQLNYGTQMLNNLDQALLYENAPQFFAFDRSRTSEAIDAVCWRSGLSTARVHELCTNAQPLTARQALALGLIDEVVDNLPAQSTRPDYSLQWPTLPPTPTLVTPPVSTPVASTESVPPPSVAPPAPPRMPTTPHNPDGLPYADDSPDHAD